VKRLLRTLQQRTLRKVQPKTVPKAKAAIRRAVHIGALRGWSSFSSILAKVGSAV
jgi:hypothetical protein